jgi:hypothetical protein
VKEKKTLFPVVGNEEVKKYPFCCRWKLRKKALFSCGWK